MICKIQQKVSLIHYKKRYRLTFNWDSNLLKGVVVRVGEKVSVG